MKNFILMFALLFGALSVWGADIPKSIQGPNVVTGESKTIRFAEAKTATVVVFLSSVCPCSGSHVPHLVELQNQFKDIAFVGVLSNSDEDPAESKAKFSGVNFPVVRDEKAKIADAFGAIKTPHAFLVNKKGEVVFRGGVTDVSNAVHAEKFYLKDAIAAVSSGKKVELAEARALGCAIKRE